MLRKALDKYRSMPVQVRASFWFLVSSFMQKAVSAISTPIFTRLLTTAEYGDFNSFLSWQSILRVFVTLNLFYGVYTSGLVKFKDRRQEFVSSMQGLTLALVLGWAAVYLVLHDLVNSLLSLTTVQMLCMITMFWTSAVFSFWAAEQRVDYKYKRLVAVTLLVTVAKPALGVILVITAKDKVTARIVGLAIVELLGFTWMFFTQVKRVRQLFSGYFWKYALRLNIPLVPHYLSQSTLISFDKIMIKNMVSSGASGIYSLAYSVASIMNFFNTALSQTISPWVYEKIKSRKETEIHTVMIPSILIIAGVNFCLIAFAPEVVRIFAPPEDDEAIWAIPPVVMSVYFIYLYDMFSCYEFYFEKTGFIALATIIAAVSNIVLNYIFIRLFGYIAAGYTTLVCYIFYAMGHYFVMRSIARKHLAGNEILPLRRLLTITLGFMGAGFLMCFLYSYPVIRYSLLGAVLLIATVFHRKLYGYFETVLDKRKKER